MTIVLFLFLCSPSLSVSSSFFQRPISPRPSFSLVLLSHLFFSCLQNVYVFLMSPWHSVSTPSLCTLQLSPGHLPLLTLRFAVSYYPSSLYKPTSPLRVSLLTNAIRALQPWDLACRSQTVITWRGCVASPCHTGRTMRSENSLPPRRQRRPQLARTFEELSARAPRLEQWADSTNCQRRQLAPSRQRPHLPLADAGNCVVGSFLHSFDMEQTRLHQCRPLHVMSDVAAFRRQVGGHN